VQRRRVNPDGADSVEVNGGGGGGGGGGAARKVSLCAFAGVWHLA